MSTDEIRIPGDAAITGAPDEWLEEHPIGAFIRHLPEM